MGFWSELMEIRTNEFCNNMQNMLETTVKKTQVESVQKELAVYVSLSLSHLLNY